MVRVRLIWAVLASLTIATFIPASTWANSVAAETAPTDVPPTEAPADTPPQPSPLLFNNFDVQVENETSRACFVFQQPVATLPNHQLDNYVSMEPAGDYAVQLIDGKLCITGLPFGSSHEVTLRAGLPAADGTTQLIDPITATVEIPDHDPSLSFRSSGTVLPKVGSIGLPLRSINIAQAKVTILHINDRNLVSTITSGMVQGSLDPSSMGHIAETQGENVYTGTLDIDSKPNEWATTAIPVKDVLTNPAPGIYVATAQPIVASKTDDDEYESHWRDVATQWFVISDLGLSAFRGEDGLSVVARSLSATAPVAQLDLTLYARNNAVLGHTTTDRKGLAHFTPGLLRGEGGNAPVLMVATNKDTHDFAFLDLSPEREVDLTDRGNSGRATAGPLDAYVVTERGIYRPGETIHATIQLRDRVLHAPAALPLTVNISRPDGVEAQTLTLSNSMAGGYSFDFPTAPTSMSGSWQIEVKADPAQPAIGTVSFLVDDFQPPRLEFDLASTAPALPASGTGQATINARFLYGAPAGNLSGKTDINLRIAPTPFADFADYHFGLEEETLLPASIGQPAFTTDASGHATIDLNLGTLPDTTHPLEASLTADIFDVGGRPVSRNMVIPVHNLPLNLGIRPSGAAKNNTNAGFDVVALDADGKATDRSKLSWTLYMEKYDYIWALFNGNWRFDPLVTGVRMSGDTFDVKAGTPAHLSVPIGDGNAYRLEVRDSNNHLVASSYRFGVGWWTPPTAQDRPDSVTITRDQTRTIAAGGTVTVHITAPYTAEATILAATHMVGVPQLVRLPEGGKDVTLAVPPEATSGFYVLASAVQKPGASTPAAGAPLRRAMGLLWVPIDPAPHQLQVKIEAPELARPDQTTEVAVHVDGAAGETAYVTLAAVDDGVLQLTKYENPNAEHWFLGQKLIGISPFDLYGNLIDPSDALKGVLHQGGDGDEGTGRQLKGLPQQTVKVVSLYSGIVKVEHGVAKVPLALPNFNGRLRLMAMAWSDTKLGQADQMMTVRAPLVADLMLPRFLAPGDTASVLLSLDNRDAVTGVYHVGLSATGPASLTPSGGQDVTLTAGQRQTLPLTLSATTVGDADFTLSITGPEGYSLTRHFNISVRAGNATMTTRSLAVLKPGEVYPLTPDLAGLLPGTTDISLTMSPIPDMDVPYLIKDLMHYPYGCAEQTVSTAMPFLYMAEVAKSLNLGTSDSFKERVNYAIAKLAAIQRSDGGFGLWGRNDDFGLWLSAYIADFLTRAGAEHYVVPTTLRTTLLAKLASEIKDSDASSRDITGKAYAFYVLAKNQSVSVPDLQYFFDTAGSQLPDVLAQSQIAAALKLAGDSERAAKALDLVKAGPPSDSDHDYYDYGSDLRNSAASITLLAEEGLMETDQLLEKATSLKAPEWRGPWFRFYNTQEESWMLLAAHALLERSGGHVHVKIGETESEQSTPVYRSLHEEQANLSVTNLGDKEVYQSISVSGVPVAAQPAASNGFTLTRSFYTPEGSPLTLTSVHQNDLVVVVLSGETSESYPQAALISDMLPAGFEIENLRISGNNLIDSMSWLSDDLSIPATSELRSDRYVAAVNLGDWWDMRSFKLAYMMRAVTPGHFFQPAPYVEDMYRPTHFARGEAGDVTIAPAQ